MAPSNRLSIVTGAGGFIASHLVELLLERGDHVRALVHYNSRDLRGHLDEVVESARAANAEWARHNRLEILSGDIQDARCVRRLVERADAVYHLAALIGIPYSYLAPQAYLNVNVQGTLNVLEACREARVPRLLTTSTSEVYGTARTVPMDEDHPLQAQSPYSASKIAADKLAQAYALSFDLPVVTVRPFNTYGPRQSARAVIPTILSQALSPDCEIIRLGATAPVRDFTFAADTARAFALLAEAPLDRVAGKVFNVAQGSGLSIGELAQLCAEVAGVNKPVQCADERVRPEASEVRRLIGDAGQLQLVTGWRPLTPIEAGLRLTADWIEAHLAQYRVGEYTR